MLRCSSCQEFFKRSEAACPHCGHKASAVSKKRLKALALGMATAGAMLATDCTPMPTLAYGGPPINRDGGSDGG